MHYDSGIMKSVLFLNFIFCVSVTADKKISLLHNSDVQARFDETSEHTSMCTPQLKEKDDCLGGFPRIATLLKRIREHGNKPDGPIVLYLFGGGIFTGTIWFKVHKEKICSDMLNALEPDAVALGEHDFDNGIEGLTKYVNGLKAPVVAANLQLDNLPDLKDKIKKSITIEKQGVKIGIVGHTYKDSQSAKQAKITLLDEVDSVKKEADELLKAGVKVIIALGNSGMKVDQNIASNVDSILIVVGGRDKILLYNGPAPSSENPLEAYPKVITGKDGKRIPIVHAYAYSKYLGCLNLTIDNDGHLVSQVGQPFLLSQTIKQDSTVQKILEGFRAKVEEEQHKKIGVTRVLLEGTKEVCGKKECSLGNLIADAYVEYDVLRNVGPHWTRTPIGLVYSGAIPGSIDVMNKQGSITRDDIMQAHSLGNQIVAFSISGQHLLKTFEAAVSRRPNQRTGEFLQYSGVQVKYDMRKAAGARVVYAKVRCGSCEIPKFEEINSAVFYNIVAPGSMIKEGSLFTDLKDHRFGDEVYPEVDIDIVAAYIEKHSPIITGERDGIIIIDKTSKSKGYILLMPRAMLNILFISVCILTNDFFPF